ncbi:unnamed protein product [Pleuronectes platessa]|uniref:Uncharacterized protein n=1 Tax=Pleuronectes platessa TaxID=8262 RepID=A0A9N7YH90_PLEPL|nr:unnamed protein product [Pleuronectes platessa]
MSTWAVSRTSQPSSRAKEKKKHECLPVRKLVEFSLNLPQARKTRKSPLRAPSCGLRASANLRQTTTSNYTTKLRKPNAARKAKKATRSRSDDVNKQSTKKKEGVSKDVFNKTRYSAKYSSGELLCNTRNPWGTINQKESVDATAWPATVAVAVL